jgi:hypothetical protein
MRVVTRSNSPSFRFDMARIMMIGLRGMNDLRGVQLDEEEKKRGGKAGTAW